MAAPLPVITFSRILNKNVLGFLRCGCRHASASAVSSNKKWQLHSAVCLQRYPRVIKPPTDLEQKYKEIMGRIELRKSLLSDYELDLVAEKHMFEKMKTMTDDEKKKLLAERSLLTMAEQLDVWTKELDNFKLADKLTDADKTGDETTVNQKLDEKLVLIVRQNWPGSETKCWTFPQGCRREGESMREAAERTLMTCCGEDVDAMFVGNAPCGYYQYQLPFRCKPDYGVKTFFFKANYTAGEVMPTDLISEWKWVRYDELPSYFQSTYLRRVRQFLIPS
ncbi:39S ribosomal protein L46, mitochondrial-like isoform X2 [Dreissena polymorpha]|uniref:Large ribosomal subunit protein mL46 n=1 Tax=Dreissena polymorpha TaxID=45954 RepID=A0A9D4K8G2_DREPO|nr:39S ribosomal protein L46, mitochondrial-like isoform X2 [Dreissena polymorpha]KAH3834777.1 hypothetical protein DPMN_108112 [Dreissena polymorpha]